MGTQLPPPQRGTAPLIFGPCVLWPNGWLDQDVTWYRGRPHPRRHCVRWEPHCPSQKGGRAPQFLAHVYCGQTAGWIKMTFGMEVGLGPRPHCARWRPSSPPQKKGGGTAPNFRPMSIVAKRLDGQRCHSAWRYVSAQATLCYRWGPSSPPQKGAQSPNFRPLSIVVKRLDESRCHLVWR